MDGAVRLHIESLAGGGRGVGRVAGRVWLVDRALPGDEVEALPVRARDRYVEARLARLLHPSDERREPPCRHQPSCGGCPWMPLDESSQRAWKRRIIGDALLRIGGLRDVRVEETIASPRALAYRNKVEFALAIGTDRQVLVGLRPSGEPERVVPIDACLLQDEGANAILSAARAALRECGPVPLLARDSGGRLVIRRSAWRQEYLVAIRGGPGPFPGGVEFARRVAAAGPRVVGVVRIVGRPDRRGGARVETLLGRGAIEARLGGIVFRVPAAAFFQVNSGAAELLVAVVVEAVGSPTRLLELYGGVGAPSLVLARSGTLATVVDADGDAIACGREAAVRAGIRGVVHVRSDVLAYLRRAGRDGAPDAVIADPPRAGLGAGVAEAIARLGPDRIAIVSCDPATLARDLRSLGTSGYRVLRVVPVDLFPQTAHVEAVAIVERGVRPTGDRPRPRRGAIRRRASG